MKKQAVWGIFDQGIQSLINLFIGLFLIRYASKEEYGLYGVGYAIILLCVGSANAFVLTQMTVNMHNKNVGDREAYCCSMFLATLLFCVIVSCLIMATSYYSGFIAHKQFIIILAVSMPGYILMEFVRRYFYLKQKPIYAFINNLCLLLLLIAILFYFYLHKFSNLHLNIFLAYSVSAFTISILTLVVFISFPYKKALHLFNNSVSESFTNGFWAFGGVIVTALQNQGWVYLIATLRGFTSIADANAARLFLSPIGIMVTSFNRVFTPKISQLNFEENAENAIFLAKKVLLILLILVFIYSTILFFMLDWLIPIFMTKEYQSLDLLIIIWIGYYMSQALRSTPSQILQVFHQFKIITLANSVTVSIWFFASIWIVRKFEVYGVIISMTVAELLLALILWRIINNVRKKSTN